MADQGGAIGRSRAVGRNRVMWVATVMTRDGSHRVRVCDLSSSGAKVQAERALPCDGDAIFRHGEMFVAARIVWSNEAEAGIQFYRPLDLSGHLPAS